MTNALVKLGWDEFFDAHLQTLQDEADEILRPARIAADFGMQCDVITDKGVMRAAISGRLRFDLDDPKDAPAVGDWVALKEGDDDLAFIAHRLRRKTELVRLATSKRPKPQVVGANLDVVFVVNALNYEFNPSRLERYLMAIRDGGIVPVVVLNKTDLVDKDQELKKFRKVCAELVGDVQVLTTAALEGEGVDEVAALIKEGKTAAFVGSSGVGKSTLVNAILDEEVLATGAVRGSDDKGRHTTTHRQLIGLSGGGVVIDTPGMREFHVWGSDDDEKVKDRYEDILEIARDCRFRDCLHKSEPGCAVIEAVESGELTEKRFRDYRTLRDAARQLEDDKKGWKK